ncbi:MAG TPA: hypothetical protein VF618_03870 [Thermoanaerobaculia bacterium]
MTYEDPIVEEVHATRERLIEKHGGPEGYAEHLRELEEQMQTRIVTRPSRPPVKIEKRVS